MDPFLGGPGDGRGSVRGGGLKIDGPSHRLYELALAGRWSRYILLMNTVTALQTTRTAIPYGAKN